MIVDPKTYGGYVAKYGHRPMSDYGEGNIPAPCAEGDILYLSEDYLASNDRVIGVEGEYLVVCAFSVGEEDEWYFRVRACDLTKSQEDCSDRLHVLNREEGVVNWLEGAILVSTADPEGLQRRAELYADNEAQGTLFDHPRLIIT